MSTAPPADWLTLDPNSISVKIVARPGSSRRGIIGVDPRGLVIAVHAPADKGRANAELIEVLAESLRLPRSAISVRRGVAGRLKTVRVASAQPAKVAAALAALVPSDR